MVRKRMLIVIACIAALLAGAAAAAEKAPQPPRKDTVRARARNARQVGVFRLKYADAASLVRQLSSTLAINDARLVGDRRTNSVVVLAPMGAMKSVEELVSKLDVPPVAVPAGPSGSGTAGPPGGQLPGPSGVQPQEPSGAHTAGPSGRQTAGPSGNQLREPSAAQPADIEALRTRNIDSRLLAKALEKMLATAPPANGSAADSAIVVLKASPGTRKALEELSGASRGTPGGAPPAAAAQPDATTKVLRLPGMSADAIAKALAGASNTGGGRSVIVLVPPLGTSRAGGKQPATKPAAERR